MTKEAIYLAALLHRAPIKEPFKLSEALEASELSREWLVGLLTESEKIVLSNPELKRVENSGYLRSIFEGLQRKGHTLEYAFSAKEMSLSGDFFPTREPEGNADDLWLQFGKAMGSLPQSNPRLYAENSMHLLHLYTVAIPCGFEGSESVSYYDFARNLAGVAVSLYDWWQTSEKEGDLSLSAGDNPFLLVGGDLSGIQDYIYQIVSKSAARNLKGRSFYLSLLADNLLEVLINRLGLFRGNVIFNSGGGFLLVAPNTSSILTELKNFEETILDRQLFESFRTTLYCALVAEPFGNGQPLNVATNAIQQQFAQKKMQKFISEVKAYGRLFDPNSVEKGGNQARDIVSGEELDEEGLKSSWLLDTEGKEDLRRADEEARKGGTALVREVTAWQILLGQKLKKIDYWIKARKPIPALRDKGHRGVDITPLNLGVYNYFLEEAQWKKVKNNLEAESLSVFQLNDLSSFSSISPGWECGFALYGGNEGPVDNLNNPKTFSEMAGARDEEKTGKFPAYEPKELDFKRLGILRMDVDGLGNLFRTSLESGDFSLAHYSALSRNMDLFFKGYLNTLWRNEEWKNDSQIIYSGGDDLFLVGRWDLVVEIAKKIKNDFNRWACYNPCLGISGGLSVVTHKYPVMKAADMAGKAEKEAKENRRGTEQKRSFTLFGKPLHWDNSKNWMDEFDLVEKLKERLTGIADTRGTPKSLLMRLMQHNLMREVQVREEKNPKWKWTIAYDLSQAEKRLSSSGQYKAEAFVRELSRAVQFEIYEGEKLESNYPFIELLAIAARWAELEIRTKKALEKQLESDYSIKQTT